MIIDSHTHAWTRWPYQPPVPDAEQRGKVEQLLHEMDLNGVDQAVIICAQIDHNPDNNAYVAAQVARFPTRLHQFVDLDSEWSPFYHQPGGADRLQRMVEQWPIKGFTHYMALDDDGSWLHSDEGQKLFRVAEKHKLIVSLSSQTYHQPAIRRVAAMFPSVPILCHHLGHPKVSEDPAAGLQQILDSARLPNIYIKLSGFAYSTRVNWEYPYADTLPIVRAEVEHFGAQRMVWGSDYPVVRFFMTYKQAWEAFNTHCSFISDDDKAWIAGKTLQGLLEQVDRVGPAVPG